MKGLENRKLKTWKENYRKSLTKALAISKNTCNTVLDKQIPQNKKYVRSNQSPFMNKTLSKALC